MGRDQVETAYFSLLRAREELTALQRYEEILLAEAQRLRRSMAEGAALVGQADRRLLRALRHTDGPLQEAVDARLAVIADERARLPARIEAATEHVGECEREHADLREGR